MGKVKKDPLTDDMIDTPELWNCEHLIEGTIPDHFDIFVLDGKNRVKLSKSNMEYGDHEFRWVNTNGDNGSRVEIMRYTGWVIDEQPHVFNSTNPPGTIVKRCCEYILMSRLKVIRDKISKAKHKTDTAISRIERQFKEGPGSEHYAMQDGNIEYSKERIV